MHCVCLFRCVFVGFAAKIVVILFLVYCVMLHSLFVCVLFVFACLYVFCLMCLRFCACDFIVCGLNRGFVIYCVLLYGLFVCL